MKGEKLKSVKSVSVKEYAEMIGKSDKTVYKMIKDGLIGAKKESKGYEVVVDTYMVDRCKDMNKNLIEMKKIIESFEMRLDKLEKKSVPKKVTTKKLVKPLKKVLKKPLKKTVSKPVKKNAGKK